MSPGSRAFVACLVAGLVPAALGPPLWPLAVFAATGRLPVWDGYATEALALAFAAALVGLAVAAFIGFPLLLAARRYRMDGPWPLAVAGALIVVALAAWYGPTSLQATAGARWPIVLFLAFLGATSGLVAGWLSRPGRGA